MFLQYRSIVGSQRSGKLLRSGTARLIGSGAKRHHFIRQITELVSDPGSPQNDLAFGLPFSNSFARCGLPNGGKHRLNREELSSDFDVQHAMRRRELVRLYGAMAGGGVLGLACQALVGWRPLPFVLSELQHTLVLSPDLNDAITSASIRLTPISGIVGGMLLGWGVASAPVGKAILGFLFPHAPPFARTDLVAERARSMILIERDAPTFVGRTTELDELADFSAGPEPFRWMSVAGPSGIGKSRLAIEWLNTQRAAGADIGVVAALPPLGWRARLPTALVLDEPWRTFGPRLPELIRRIATSAGPGRKVRLLVLDHVAWRSLPVSRRSTSPSVHEAKPAATMRLEPLPAADSLRLWEVVTGGKAAAKGLDAARGSPRAMILLAHTSAISRGEALRDWASDLLPELVDPLDTTVADLNRIRALCLAVLAGPLPSRAVRQLCGSGFNLLTLQRFWPFANLSRELPALEPEDLAQEVLVRGFGLLGHDGTSEIFRLATARNPDGVVRTVRALWRARQANGSAEPPRSLGTNSELEFSQDDVLLRLQAWLDKAMPELAQRSVEVVNASAHEMAAAAAVETIRVAFESAAAELDARPFDTNLLLAFAPCAGAWLHTLGSGFLFEEVEHWADWWHTHLGRSLSGEASLEVQRVGEIHCIMEHYGEARRFTDLERWAARSGVPNLERPSCDPSMAGEQAALIATAIGAYERVGDLASLRRWASVALRFAEVDARDLPGRFQIAIADSFSALSRAHAVALDWPGAQKWHAKIKAFVAPAISEHVPDALAKVIGNMATLIALIPASTPPRALQRLVNEVVELAQTPAAAGDKGCRIWTARALGNAVNRFCESKRLTAAEDCISQLVSLGADEELVADFAEVLIQAASRLAIKYCETGDEASFQKWLSFICQTADRPQFADSVYVRSAEVRALGNIFIPLAQQNRLQDVESFGERVKLKNRPAVPKASLEIARAQAHAAVNAVVAYDLARRFGSPARANWRLLLARCAAEFPSDPVIQSAATLLNVTFADQERQGWPFGPPPHVLLPAPGDRAIAAARRTRSKGAVRREVTRNIV